MSIGREDFEVWDFTDGAIPEGMDEGLEDERVRGFVGGLVLFPMRVFGFWEGVREEEDVKDLCCEELEVLDVVNSVLEELESGMVLEWEVFLDNAEVVEDESNDWKETGWSEPTLYWDEWLSLKNGRIQIWLRMGNGWWADPKGKEGGALRNWCWRSKCSPKTRRPKRCPVTIKLTQQCGIHISIPQTLTFKKKYPLVMGAVWPLWHILKRLDSIDSLQFWRIFSDLFLLFFLSYSVHFTHSLIHGHFSKLLVENMLLWRRLWF